MSLNPLKSPPKDLSKMPPMQLKIYGFIAVVIICCAIGLAIFDKHNTNNNVSNNINFLANTNSTNDNGNINSRPSICTECIKKTVSQATCADKRNDLYTIDNAMIVWIREGNCPDNGYAYTLYSGSLSTILCSQVDSLTGPKTTCPNDNYKSMFGTILVNLDDPALGIGADHQVVKVTL